MYKVEKEKVEKYKGNMKVVNVEDLPTNMYRESWVKVNGEELRL